MDSYRVEKQAAEAIILADENAEIDPTAAIGGGHIPELDMNPLSVILEEFNQLWGIEFTDADQVSSSPVFWRGWRPTKLTRLQ